MVNGQMNQDPEAPTLAALLALPSKLPLAWLAGASPGLCPLGMGCTHSREGWSLLPMTSGIGRSAQGQPPGSMGTSLRNGPQTWRGCLTSPGRLKAALSLLSLKPLLGSSRGGRCLRVTSWEEFPKCLSCCIPFCKEPIWGSWLEEGLAGAFLSLADFFLNIVPESKAIKYFSPHSDVSVVAAEQWWEGTPHRGERASPWKACWYPSIIAIFCPGWPSPPWTWCPHGGLALQC